MKRIKSGDTVVVIAGKSKGHIGKVLKVDLDRVHVEGANLIKKHVKPNPRSQQPGGIVTKEAGIHVSNVAIYDAATSKAQKVGFKYLDQNDTKRKVRYIKSTGELLDLPK